MKKILLIISVFLSLSLWCQAASTINQFSYYKCLNVNTTSGGANISSTLSNFPVQIHICKGCSNNFRNEEITHFFGSWNLQGKRIQAFAGDLTINLPFEVAYYNALTGEAIYFVTPSSITGNNTNSNLICLAYGNDPNGADQDSPTSVWDSNFVMVNHLQGFNFKSYKYSNGVITAGTENGNSYWIEEPYVVPPSANNSNTWQMWAHVKASSYMAENYYTSSDGVSWTYQSQALLNYHRGMVVYNSDDSSYPYYLYVANNDDAGIYLFKSASPGGSYSSQGQIITLGSSGAWDYPKLTEPYVWREDSTHWYMTYIGGSYTAGSWPTGLATSSDGVIWTKDPSNPVVVTGFPAPATPYVVIDIRWIKRVNGVYWALAYAKTAALPNDSSSPVEIYLLKSLTTGTNIQQLRGPWTVVGGILNPFLARDFDWEGLHNSNNGGCVANPSVAEYGGQTYIYYDNMGTNGNATWPGKVGLALFPVDFNTLIGAVYANMGDVTSGNNHKPLISASNYNIFPGAGQIGSAKGSVGEPTDKTYSDSFSMSNPSDFSFTGDWTISVWADFTSLPSGYIASIFEKGYDGSNTPEYLDWSGNNLRFGAYCSGTTSDVEYAFSATNTWEYLSGIRDGNIWRLRMNASELANASKTTRCTNTMPATIGARWRNDLNHYDSWFPGYLQEIRFSNVRRLDNWSKAEYYSMKKNTNFGGDGWITWNAEHFRGSALSGAGGSLKAGSGGTVKLQ